MKGMVEGTKEIGRFLGRPQTPEAVRGSLDKKAESYETAAGKWIVAEAESEFDALRRTKTGKVLEKRVEELRQTETVQRFEGMLKEACARHKVARAHNQEMTAQWEQEVRKKGALYREGQPEFVQGLLKDLEDCYIQTGRQPDAEMYGVTFGLSVLEKATSYGKSRIRGVARECGASGELAADIADVTLLAGELLCTGGVKAGARVAQKGVSTVTKAFKTIAKAEAKSEAQQMGKGAVRRAANDVGQAAVEKVEQQAVGGAAGKQSGASVVPKKQGPPVAPKPKVEVGRDGPKGAPPKAAESSVKTHKKDGTPYHPTYLANQEKARLAEAAAERTLLRAGYKKLLSKMKGDRGFDGIFSKTKGAGERGDLVVVESKFSSLGRVRLSRTKTKGGQMDDKWIKGTIKEMRKGGSALVKQTGELMAANMHLIRGKVNVMDKTGANKWNKVKLPNIDNM